MKPLVLLVFLVAAPGMGTVWAQDEFDGIDFNHSDGALTVSGAHTIHLAAAKDSVWSATSDGNGIYDAEKWAVVFHYSSVNIAAGDTVTFENHPSGAPVVWLVDTSVHIEGIVSLNGKSGHPPGSLTLPYESEPGPGGFRGGRGGSNTASSSAGFGPGGGRTSTGFGSGASYATTGEGDYPGTTYGNKRILPLIGGSGGSGRMSNSNFQAGGGAGGGALLIVARDSIVVASNAIVRARGATGGDRYTGGGSGGAIRLLSRRVRIDGSLNVSCPIWNYGHEGGNGRIRLEANEIFLGDPNSLIAEQMGPLVPVTIWPPDEIVLRIDTINSVPVLENPLARLDPGDADVPLESDAIDVGITAMNLPLDWDVVVLVVPRGRNSYRVSAVKDPGGDETLSTWTASVPTADVHSAALQVLAKDPSVQ